METKNEKAVEIAKEVNFTELEDRLEMAQVAEGDVNRCGGSSSSTTTPTK